MTIFTIFFNWAIVNFERKNQQKKKQWIIIIKKKKTTDSKTYKKFRIKLKEKIY